MAACGSATNPKDWPAAPDGKFQLFHESDGLPGPGVYAIWKDAEGVLWLGGRWGLARWEGNQHWVVPADSGFGGLPVTQIVEDEQKRLWLGTPEGIWRLSRQELAELAAGKRKRLHACRLGMDEGMPSGQCTGSFNYVGTAPPKDRLYFGTAGGLASFEPQAIPPAGPPPELRLQSVSVAGREVWRAPTFGATGAAIPAELTLAPGSRQVRIAFTGFHYTAPEHLRFSYCLGGGRWSMPSSTRTALFEYLPAGRHELRVVACSADGAWNESGISLVLNVRPWFWQTPWFFGLVVLGFAAAAGLTTRTITRRRWKARVEKLKQTEAVQKERARIARDIHDDLGAGLTQVIALSELAQVSLDDPLRHREHLEQIFQEGRGMVRSLDEIVWAINPANDQTENFIAYLGSFAERFLRLAGLRCRLNLPVNPPSRTYSSALRHNVFLAVKEAMNNAVRHAQASEVLLRIRISDDELEVAVEDNGRGLPEPTASTASGTSVGQDGLVSMDQRLREIGGRLEWHSRPGQGTRLTMRVPLQDAET